MKLEQSFEVDAPLEQVWALLIDVQRVAPCLPGAELTEVAVCEDWDEGLAASLRCGVEAAGDADWVLITLGDEPALPPGAIDDVVRTARGAPPAIAAVRARWSGRLGHPVALRASLAARVRDRRGDTGARALLETAVVLEVECGHLGAPSDVDTPADLEALDR